MDADVDGWVAPGVAARMLEVSYSRVRQLVAAGRLEVRYTSLGMEVRRDSLEALREEREARR